MMENLTSDTVIVHLRGKFNHKGSVLQ